MNIKIFTLLTVFFLTALSLHELNAQDQAKADTADYPYWIEMMQDPEANYYETVSAFETYWADREVTKGSGWKPFKRWEYMMRYHIYPNGERLAPDHDIKEFNKFLRNNPPERDFTGNWVNLGPFTIPVADRGYQGLGRINAVAFHPTDPDIMYIGAPSGGLWKTTVGGNDWSSTTDDLPSLGVSSIIVDYVNPDIVYMGTGDRDANDAPGIGVYRSTDAGQTWEEWNDGMGNKTVGRMIQHPADNQLILAASSGGIYKTTDAGANWVLKENGDFKEIVFKADDPSVVFASKTGQFFKSTDTGESWTQITNGIPSGAARGVIAVTPANPDVVYFLITTSTSYKATCRSTDAGNNFTVQSTSPNVMSWGCNGGSGGQAWYDLDIAADPTDEDVIYVGGVNVFKSTNGGVTWDINSHWWGDCGVSAVHADLHAFEYNPVDGRLYACNDGGIYWTDNGGTTWTEITNDLPISQAYKIGQSATARNLVINGYQDNGTSTYVGDPTWLAVHGGDGMECAIDHEDSTYSYATVYYGSIYRMKNHDNTFQVAGNGVFGINEGGAWVTPFCLAEHDANTMFVGYTNVWRCENVKSYSPNWKNISGNFSGGYCNVVEHSPADENLFYVAKNNGWLYRSDNAMGDDPVWTELSDELPGSYTVTDIEAHPTNPDIVYLTMNFKVYKSTDRGMTWEDISDNLPNVSLNDLAYYENSQDGLYVGSNAGIYYKDNGMDDWLLFSDGFPASAEVTEIEIFYDPDSVKNDVIRVGTYGRGLWESAPHYYAPSADFYADETELPVGCSINFFDESEGVPHEWNWTFEGATPASSTEQNPTDIVYNEEGTFAVSLEISNPEGTDMITKTEYITVSSTTVPNVDFTSSETNVCVGDTVYLTDLTENCPTDWFWEFEPDEVNFIEGTDAYSQHPVVEITSAGAYNLTLTATNNAGDSALTKDEFIIGGGISIPFADDFESGNFTDHAWVVENPDQDKTWEIGPVGGNGPGDQAVWINFFEYYSMNARDRLITPSLDFSEFENAFLTFKHAYAQRYNQKDSLIVLVSTDCGITWERVFASGPDGNGVFATSEATTEYFVPETAEDWCGAGYGADCFSIDLSAYLDNTDVKIAFESMNNFGNNLYLDDILVDFAFGNNENLNPERHLAVIPNPNSGEFIINLEGYPTNVELKIFSVMGEMLVSKKTAAGENASLKFDLSEFSNGVYFVVVAGKDFYEVEKIIVE